MRSVAYSAPCGCCSSVAAPQSQPQLRRQKQLWRQWRHRRESQPSRRSRTESYHQSTANSTANTTTNNGTRPPNKAKQETKQNRKQENKRKIKEKQRKTNKSKYFAMFVCVKKKYWKFDSNSKCYPLASVMFVCLFVCLFVVALFHHQQFSFSI